MSEMTLDIFKGTTPYGYLVFTDAIETGEDMGEFVVIIDNTRPGIDHALMNIGFSFDVPGHHSPPGMYWMQKTDQGSLRYHPILDKGIPLMITALAYGMKTRIDFFCPMESNVAYEVVSELLRFGYRVLFFSPRSVMIKKLFLAERGIEGVHMSEISLEA